MTPITAPGKIKAIAHHAALIFALALALVTSRAPAAAQSAEPYYRGKEITLLIGSSAGGGYDTFARAVAAHWGKHIPGNPVFVPQNLPGPMSLPVANRIFSVAPKDGTV